MQPLTPISAAALPFKTQPFPYQIEALVRSVHAEGFALLQDMGTGKSKVLIDTACCLWREKEISGMLLVVPKGIVPNWTGGEFPAHMWDSVPHRIGVWRADLGKRGMEELVGEVVRTRFKGLRVLVMNIDALSTARGKEFAQSFLESGPMLMAIDESTAIKSPKSLRTKAAIALGKLAKYRRIATGMPIEQSPLDVWSQFEFLHAGVLGFRSFFGFRMTYANIVHMAHGSRSYQKVIGFRSLDRLQQSMAPYSFRVLKSEALPYLKPKSFTTWAVSMTDEQARLYKEMKKYWVSQVSTDYGEQRITAQQAVVQLLRLHQILCGHLTVVDHEGAQQVQAIPSNRPAALLEILCGLTGKAVIWAAYQYNITEIRDAIAEAYGHKSVVTFYGNTSDGDRAEAIDRFQHGPECRWFVATAATGGSGLTLTAADTVVYYANTHRAGHRAQSEDRVHRAGQRKAVTYIDMLVPGTIDEKILEGLRTKRGLADLIIDGGIESVI